MERVFSGKKNGYDRIVEIEQNGRVVPLPLAPSLEIAEHSPDGFNWGYNGSAAAQLALGILYEVTGVRSRRETITRFSRRIMCPDGVNIGRCPRAKSVDGCGMWELEMYDVGQKPTRSQAFARVICHIAVKERGLRSKPLILYYQSVCVKTRLVTTGAWF